MNQLSLNLQSARAAGMAAADAALRCAEKEDPLFSEKAKAAILAHLRVVGQCSGEELVDIAKAHGAIPRKGDRAFGPVFQALLRQNKVHVISYAPRLKGHGCMGAKVYALCYPGSAVSELPAILQRQAA